MFSSFFFSNLLLLLYALQYNFRNRSITFIQGINQKRNFDLCAHRVICMNYKNASLKRNITLNSSLSNAQSTFDFQCGFQHQPYNRFLKSRSSSMQRWMKSFKNSFWHQTDFLIL